MPFTIPSEYGYVLGAATASVFLATYHGILTGGARKQAKIPYPNAYAPHEVAIKDPAAMRFNCAQRAQTNFIENYPGFLVSLFVAGLAFPITGASLGFGWVASRFLFAYGYVNRGPSGRFLGATHYLCLYSLMCVASYSSYILATS